MTPAEIVLEAALVLAVIGAAIFLLTRPHVIALFNAKAEELRLRSERERRRAESDFELTEAWAEGYDEGRKYQRYVDLKRAPNP